MAQKTGIGIFLAVALIAAAALFYAAFAEHSENTVYLGLKKAETEREQIGIDADSAGSDEEELREEAEDFLEKQEKTVPENTDRICAFVCGSIKHAGIYELSEGARLSDFIEAAGGFSKKAAKEYLNLAEKAQDGQRIYVPSKKEARKWKKKAVSESSEELAAPNGKININTAGKEELMTLAGIGESKADAIISYREENGKFHKTEELMQISGIKEGVYKKICNNIIV